MRVDALHTRQCTLTGLVVVLVEAGVQVQQRVEAQPLDAGGLLLEHLVHALVHEREQLVHVAVVRALREHLAQRLDVPRALLGVAVRHVPCTARRSVLLLLLHRRDEVQGTSMQ